MHVNNLVRCLLVVLLAGLLTLAGCKSMGPPDPMMVGLEDTCRVLPCCFREHVYVVMIDGLNPTGCSGLAELLEYVHELGYHKTYYGQFFYADHFQKEICRIHKDDPDAQFIVIGSGAGADFALKIAAEGIRAGLPIDAVLTLYGNCLKNCSEREVFLVERTCEQAGSATGQAGIAGDADNVPLVNGGAEIHSPALPQEVIARELAASTAKVVAHEPAAASVARGRPLRQDEWSFLQPQELWPAGMAARPAQSPARAEAPGVVNTPPTGNGP